jgi:cytochrome P450
MSGDLDTLVRIEEPAFYTDAVPVYHRLQREAPVYYYEPLDMFVLTKHEDVRYAAHRCDLFSNESGILLTEFLPTDPGDQDLVAEFFDPAGEVFPMTDPPRHRTLRRLVAPAFTPKALAKIGDELKSACRTLVVTIPTGRTIDYVDAVASRLPILFASRLMGTTTGDVELIRKWSDSLETVGSGTITREELREHAAEFKKMGDFFRCEFERKRDEPGTDLVGTLLEAELDGEKLSEARLLAYCTLIMGTGTDTTRALLTGMAIALAEHPDQLRRLRDDRTLMPSAIDEAMRWVTPARGFVRTAMADTEVRGQKIRAGQRVYLLYSAGNVDPEVFPNPEVFDITREESIKHLGFGFGVHICIAAQLVKMEANMLFNMILDRFQTFELTGRPDHVTHLLRNGWRSAPIAFR